MHIFLCFREMGPRTCPAIMSRGGWSVGWATDASRPVVERTPTHTHIYTDDARGVSLGIVRPFGDKSIW